MTERRKWVVTLSHERPLDDIRRAMDEAGFETDQVLDAIGVVTGAGSAEVAERLRGMSGIADVSPDSPIDLGPPDSPTTW
jgi:hypothetical protein